MCRIELLETFLVNVGLHDLSLKKVIPENPYF
jgi:hypothetical protein